MAQYNVDDKLNLAVDTVVYYYVKMDLCLLELFMRKYAYPFYLVALLLISQGILLYIS